MLKNLIIFPIFAVLFLSFAVQLVDIAESTSEKAIGFTLDMQEAVDCATRGVDMEICSPGLFEHNFDDEIKRTKEVNLEFIKEVKDKINYTDDYIIKKEGNEIIIKEIDQDFLSTSS